MKKAQLVMTFCGHQPMGDFDQAFERATQLCYEPFLEALERHERIQLGLHLSGCLLEWLEAHRPAFFERLAKLVDSARIELLGGGMYEPVLSVLPEADATAQIELLGEYLEDRFGKQPRGLWLAECDWEPHLAELISLCGLRYTLVDDSAFFRAGLVNERLSGYWVTEHAGEVLSVLPIDRGLRRSVLVQPIEQIPQKLRQLCDRPDRLALTYGEELERFGPWSKASVQRPQPNRLEALFAALEQAADWLEVVSPGTLLEGRAPAGRIYLPTSTCAELQDWALPTAALSRRKELVEQLDRLGLAELADRWGPCAPWANFLAKYPEANHMHKKMLLVSQKLSEALEDEEPWEDEHEEARRCLYRGQCACAYWHGTLGGLYLAHLRQAVYRELIRAERVLDRRVQGEEDWIAYDQVDFDGDLSEEVVVENAQVNVYISPAQGGVVTELDHRPTANNLTCVMTRRPEPTEMPSAPPREGEPSAGYAEHEDEDEPGPLDQAVYDRVLRSCFLDRFLAPMTALEQLQRSTYTEEGDFLQAAYSVEQIGIDEQGDCDFEVCMKRVGKLTRGQSEHPLTLEKRIRVPADRAEVYVDYRLSNPSDQPLDLLFCPELNLSLPVGDEAKQSYEFDGWPGQGPRVRSAGEVEDAAWLALLDPDQRLRLDLKFSPATKVWRYPVETVSRSMRGPENNYQGSAVAPLWELTIPARSSHRFSIRLSVALMEGSTDDDALVPLAEPEDEAPEET